MADTVATRVCYMKILVAARCDDGLDRERVEQALSEFFEEAKAAERKALNTCEDCGGTLYCPSQCDECAELQACTDSELHEQDHGPGRI